MIATVPHEIPSSYIEMHAIVKFCVFFPSWTIDLIIPGIVVESGISLKPGYDPIRGPVRLLDVWSFGVGQPRHA